MNAAAELLATILLSLAAMVMVAIFVLGIVSGAFKDVCEQGAEELKSSWPILLVLTIIAFLPFTVSLICGWC